MNEFALNDAELNGTIEVWIDDAIPASIQMDGAGWLSKARFVDGVATSLLSSSGSATKKSMASGAAMALLSATWPPSVRKQVGGFASAPMQAGGSLVRRAMAAGFAQEQVVGDGEASVFGPPRANFFIKMLSGGEVVVSRSVALAPKDCFIETRSSVIEYARKNKAGSGDLQLWLNPTLGIGVKMQSSEGVAGYSIAANGGARFGNKVGLDGETASVLSYATCELSGIHYVYIGSTAAEVKLNATWQPVGGVNPSEQYIPAQEERVMFVPMSGRVLSVPHDDRSLYVDREESCALIA